MRHIHFYGGPLDSVVMQVTDVKDDEEVPPELLVPLMANASRLDDED